jgi:signal transduction histidine kinase
VAIYGFGAYKATGAENYESAFFWWQISYIGVIMLPALFMHFVYEFLDIRRSVLIKIIYLICFVILFTDIFTPSIFLGQVSLKFQDSTIFTPAWWVYPPGPLHIFHTLVLYTGVLIYVFIKMLCFYNRLSKSKQLQMKYFVGAMVLGFVGGGTSYLPCFNINLYPVLNVTVPVYTLIIAYTVVRYNLMDIEVIIKKTVVFAGLLTALMSVIIAISFVLQQTMGKFVIMPEFISYAVILISVLAVYEPLKKFLINVTDKYLFQKQYDPRQVIGFFIDYAATVLDLDKLISETTEIIEKTFHPVFLDLLLRKNSEYLPQKHKYNSRVSGLNGGSAIVNYLKNTKSILCVEIRNSKKISGGVKQEMAQSGAVLAVPLILRNQLTGIIFLGKKRSDELYTPDDLSVLMDLAGTDAIAISNALTHMLLLQAQRRQVKSEHLISMGYLVTNLSHEMRNPMHVISGVADDALDVIETELNDIKDERHRKSLAYVCQKLNECMNRSEKAEKLFNSILNVISIDKGKFAPVKLKRVIDEVIMRTRPYIKGTKITIENHIKENFPAIECDEITIEQTFFNLVYNAIQAMILSGKGDQIHIRAFDEGNKARVEVEDNSCGISQQDVNRIFEPFYTTKENLHTYAAGKSRGIGIGLMLVHQIIIRHGGTISVKSEENKGTKFTVEIPGEVKKKEAVQ